MTVATPPFEKIFGGQVRTVPGNTCVIFEVPSLIALELLAFNAQKFRWSRDPDHAPFWENFWSHVRTVPWNMFVKFEVRSFNRFGAISI